MNPITFFWKSSIGKKWLVALTGIVLVAYVFGHLAGNLQIFLGPAKINAYAQFLHSLGPILLAVRLFLIACFVLHIVMTIKLVTENRAAKPTPYIFPNSVQSKVATRTMAISGLIVLSFVIYHLLHFTIRSTDARFKPITAGGKGLLHGEYDVYSMIILGFGPSFLGVLCGLFYLLGVGLLCLHLSHGFSSLLQTLGVTTKKTLTDLQRAGQVVAALVFLGYASIPFAVWFGILTLRTSL